MAIASVQVFTAAKVSSISEHSIFPLTRGDWLDRSRNVCRTHAHTFGFAASSFPGAPRMLDAASCKQSCSMRSACCAVVSVCSPATLSSRAPQVSKRKVSGCRFAESAWHAVSGSSRPSGRKSRTARRSGAHPSARATRAPAKPFSSFEASPPVVAQTSKSVEAMTSVLTSMLRTDGTT